jgi:hypothetical protein
MKLITWFLILCFTTQAFAGTVREDLTSALNDYEYNMVVEWDQKDSAKAEAFNKEFSSALEKLFKQGLTQEELLSVVEKRVTSKERFEAIKMKASLLQNSASDARSIADLLQRELSDMGHRGASWNGEVQMYVLAIVPLVLLGALIIYQHMWNQSHRCVEAAREEVCHSVCDDYSYRDTCSTWDDSTCTTGEYCVSSHEECGLEEFCKEWEKI